MAWWIWIVVGVVFCVSEAIFTPGVFVLLFFGISAFLIGALAAIGLAAFWIQVIIFLVVAVLLLVLFRGKARQFLGLKGAKMDFDSIVGGNAVAREEIAAGASGKVEFRGSSWNATNIGPHAIYPGDQCRIEHVQGLQLSVKAARE